MSTFVISQPKDTLDAVAWRTLGTTAVLTEVIDLNPHINQLDPILQPGTQVELPNIQRAQSNIQKLINLWD